MPPPSAWGPHRLLPTQAATEEPWEAGEPPRRTDAQHAAQSKVGEQLGASLKDPIKVPTCRKTWECADPPEILPLSYWVLTLDQPAGAPWP